MFCKLNLLSQIFFYLALVPMFLLLSCSEWVTFEILIWLAYLLLCITHFNLRIIPVSIVFDSIIYFIDSNGIPANQGVLFFQNN